MPADMLAAFGVLRRPATPQDVPNSELDFPFANRASVAEVRRDGAFSSSYVRGRGSRVVGLVPDGVAAIEFAFARGRSLDPEPARRRTYAQVYRRMVHVVDNVVALTVPRLPFDALFYRQVWRAADGSVVNVVRGPGVKAG